MTRLHKMLFSLAMVAAAGLVGVSKARAQTTLSPEIKAAIEARAPAGPVVPAIEVKQGSGDVRYISGGAGVSAREAMDARRSEYPFKVVLSAYKGEYIIAETFRLKSSKGELINTSEVGPLVMIDAPPGSYTLEVGYQGQTRSRKVTIGKQPKQVNVSFSG